MKKVTYKGKTYEFESVDEREERLTKIANVGIQALAPEMEGLNAYEVHWMLRIMNSKIQSSLKFSAGHTTAELVNLLRDRDGVETVDVSPYEEYETKLTGPAIVLKVVD